MIKRLICLFIIFVLLMTPLGCSKNDSPITLHFYYPRQNYGYDMLNGRFFPQSAMEELRRDIPYTSARQVIGVYLQGPSDPLLTNPFPGGTVLTDLSIEGDILYLTLSDQFACLSGIPMIMACSCLAKTCIALTKVSAVHIRCESALLDGEKTMIANESAIFFDDPAVVKNEQ